ncbi:MULTISPECIES: hypothetical protein [Ensifer]|uniref:Transposase n=1 Tax=Ensifer canadensis TaxID=555315 RepID=A0AAW4FHG9_9HYPH|nr:MULTISPECIES: hypothetical protein [Ensifer]MBD9487873.1 hypothetical protein [Ensifer sp. ENS11]MBM3090444.1 hypothetical protein [Ensifer canadensis]UBI80913.1 hypothetical protein J3R84_35360 [Ensifer canadensis]
MRISPCRHAVLDAAQLEADLMIDWSGLRDTLETPRVFRVTAEIRI